MAEKTITELTDLYFNRLGMSHANINWKKKVFKDIYGASKKGFSLTEIEKAIINDPENFKGSLKTSNKDNLIEHTQFYYHPYLQVAPSAPTIQLNNDGTFTEIHEEFYLQLREVFTFDDATEYFYEKFPTIPVNKKRDIGGITYLYSKIVEPLIDYVSIMDMNSLDLLLFTMDSASAIAYDDDRRFSGILNLQDYVEEGLYIYKEKMHFARLNGLDTIQ